MKKLIQVKEKHINGIDVLRQIDILLSNDDAKRESLEEFALKFQNFLSDQNKQDIKSITVNKGKKVITVVFKDGAKQIVKCHPKDTFDPEIGFALALVRNAFGSKTQVRKFIAENAKNIEKSKKRTKEEHK